MNDSVTSDDLVEFAGSSSLDVVSS